MDEFITAATVDEIPPGQSRVVVIHEQPVAIFNVNGEFFAIENICPHMASPLDKGEVRNGTVVCPCHAWTFDLRTGRMVNEPTCRLPVYEVHVVGKEIRVHTTPDSAEVARVGKEILRRVTNGEPLGIVANNLGLSKEQVQEIADHMRIAERLAWISRQYLMKGKLQNADFREIPYHKHKAPGDGVAEKLEELIKLL